MGEPCEFHCCSKSKRSTTSTGINPGFGHFSLPDRSPYGSSLRYKVDEKN